MKEKKIGIICNLMTGYGGVQVCVIELVKALNRRGYKPTLITDTAPDFDILSKEDLDMDVLDVKYSISHSTLKKWQPVLSRIREFVYYFRSSWLNSEFDFLFFFQHDIIIDDNTKHLCYLSNSPITHYAPNPLLNKTKIIFYKLFVKRFIPIFEWNNYDSVINSNFTSNIYRDFYKKELDVVYPPNALGKPKQKPVKESRTCIILSRIERPKRMELAIDLARLFPEMKFRIVGGVTSDSRDYVDSLKQLIFEYELDNVDIFENVSYERNIELLSKSEFYLFLAENEHFGITTVEAINYGCIPLVHNSGGQREIVPINELRFDYNELVDVFKSNISKPDSKLEEYRIALLEHAERFDTLHYTKALISRMESQL